MPEPMSTLTLSLPDETATARLGLCLAELVQPGDTILLRGEIGAGKTHLARSLIRQRLGRMEDVPSPTFTLVQTYEAEGGDIWHADLYRLSGPDEIAELGLEDAFTTAICLIEWPDRLGDQAPPDALSITLSPAGNGRTVTLAGAGRADFLDRLHHLWRQNA